MLGISSLNAADITELTAVIEKAVKEKSSEDYLKLLYKNGAPDEVKKALSPMIETLFKKEQVKNVKAFSVSDYKPKIDLPGEINEKKLAYTSSPTHWVVVQFARDSKVKLVIPAAQFGDKWEIVGVKLKD